MIFSRRQLGIGTLSLALLLQVGLVPVYWKWQALREQIVAIREDLADAPVVPKSTTQPLTIEIENQWQRYASQVPTWETMNEFVDKELPKWARKNGVKLRKRRFDPQLPFENGFHVGQLTIEATGTQDQLLAFWRTWESFSFLTSPKQSRWTSLSSGRYRVIWIFDILLV